MSDTTETSTPAVTQDVLLDALKRLGTSESAIAAGLKNMGYKGDHDPTSCPVANYLRDQFPGESVRVGGGGWSENWLQVNGAGFTYEETPIAVKVFVSAFDSGRHKELEPWRARIARRLHLR